VRDWLGEPGPVDRDAALAELARRFLAGHGPADERDLAKWAGLPLRDARAGLRAIGGGPGERRAAELPPPRLLGAFDPLLLGWRDRTPLVGKHDRSIVGGGMFRPVALARGRVVATWALRGDRVELDLLERVSRRDAAALERDGQAVRDYLSGAREARSATDAPRRAARAASR
jgi:winged helix DNA-binding protein